MHRLNCRQHPAAGRAVHRAQTFGDGGRFVHAAPGLAQSYLATGTRHLAEGARADGTPAVACALALLRGVCCQRSFEAFSCGSAGGSRSNQARAMTAWTRQSVTSGSSV